MSLEDKWKNDKLSFSIIEINDMQCKNCFYNTGKPATCKIYKSIKPAFVINNTGKKCDFFKKI